MKPACSWNSNPNPNPNGNPNPNPDPNPNPKRYPIYDWNYFCGWLTWK